MPNEPGLNTDGNTDPGLQYLRLLQSVPSRSRGPFREFGGSPEPEAFQTLGRKIATSVQRIDEHTYRAPSAWHAAAFLLDVCFLIGTGASSETTRALQAPYNPSMGTPVFRGQRNPNWEIKAGIYRSPRTQDDDWIALNIYVDAVSHVFRHDESRMLGRYAHLAEAQHYGMRTDQHYGMRTHLLDFTADPRVAVYFACRDESGSSEEDAVVYFAPLNLLAQLGGAVVLPPPWVQRLYAQRGLFVDCAELPKDLDLRQMCMRILFPRSAQFANSVFGDPAVVLEPPDPWYEKAIAWSLTKAKTFKLNQVDTLTPTLIEECGPPPFLWGSQSIETMLRSFEQFTDMCEWLTLKVVNGTYHYDLNSLDLLLQHNAPFFRSLRITWKFLTGQFPSLSLDRTNGDRTLAAMEAIAFCVEQAARDGRLPSAI